MQAEQKCSCLQGPLLFRQKWDVGRKREEPKMDGWESWTGKHLPSSPGPLHATFIPSLCAPSLLCLSLAAAQDVGQLTGPHRQCPSDRDGHPWVLIASFWKRMSDSCLPPPSTEDTGSPWSV